jgi:hypothetical protein
MPEWHKALTIVPLSPEKPSPEKGDKLQNAFGNITLTPTVLVRTLPIFTIPLFKPEKLTPRAQENTERAFKWRGSFYGLLYGEHCFRFEPSTTTPGSTTLHQEEEFSGILGFMARPGFPFGKDTKKAFEVFNADIKARVESLGEAGTAEASVATAQE